MLKVSDKTTSARAKAASASPMAWLKPTATLVPHSGWTRGPPGSAAALRDDHRDDLADVARAVAAEGELRRLAEVERDGGGEARRRGAEERQRLQPAREVGVREDGGDPGQRLRRRGVDPRDAGVGVGRADERRVKHGGERHVVDEPALAAQKPRVLAPLHRRAEVLRAHQPSPAKARLYTTTAAAGRYRREGSASVC